MNAINFFDLKNTIYAKECFLCNTTFSRAAATINLKLLIFTVAKYGAAA